MDTTMTVLEPTRNAFADAAAALPAPSTAAGAAEDAGLP
jgi:hypothetical protein